MTTCSGWDCENEAVRKISKTDMEGIVIESVALCPECVLPFDDAFGDL